MGLYNKYAEYNAEEEAAKQRSLLQCLEENESPQMQEQQTPTVKIEKMTGGGSSYSAVCPNCGKLKFLSSELNSMRAVCNKCYCVFNLEE